MHLSNRTTEQWQKIDSAHHLHPFTDFKELINTGTRVIISGEGNYVLYNVASAEQSRVNLSIDSQNSLIIVNVVSESFTGEINITLTIIDSNYGPPQTTSFQLHILPVNTPPELNNIGKHRSELQPEDIFYAVKHLHQRCKGGYAAVAMITGVGILGFRDPKGIRPIVFGDRKTDDGAEFIIASESVAIDALDFQLIRDIKPGEAVFITVEGEVYSQQCSENINHSPCIFEYVYLARPDSIIDGISVYKARLRMGETLAQKILELYPTHDIDVVIPIPDSSRTAALSLAYDLGIKYREGFVKNRYIPRTFIMPGQNIRKKSVRQKLNAINLEFKDKNVLLVDDSIVRGTTSREIVQMAKEAGAKRVYIASAAPPVRHPNVYGIDMPSVNELIAYNRSADEVAETIGADWLVYQDIEDLIASAQKGNDSIAKFDTSCFTGEYITGDVSEDYLARIESQRNDSAKETKNIDEGLDEGLTDLTKNQ